LQLSTKKHNKKTKNLSILLAPFFDKKIIEVKSRFIAFSFYFQSLFCTQLSPKGKKWMDGTFVIFVLFFFAFFKLRKN